MYARAVDRASGRGWDNRCAPPGALTDAARCRGSLSAAPCGKGGTWLREMRAFGASGAIGVGGVALDCLISH